MKVFAAFLMTCALSPVLADTVPAEQLVVLPNAQLATPVTAAWFHTSSAQSKRHTAGDTPTQRRCLCAHVKHALRGQRGLYRR